MTFQNYVVLGFVSSGKLVHTFPFSRFENLVGSEDFDSLRDARILFYYGSGDPFVRYKLSGGGRQVPGELDFTLVKSSKSLRVDISAAVNGFSANDFDGQDVTGDRIQLIMTTAFSESNITNLWSQFSKLQSTSVDDLNRIAVQQAIKQVPFLVAEWLKYEGSLGE